MPAFSAIQLHPGADDDDECDYGSPPPPAAGIGAFVRARSGKIRAGMSESRSTSKLGRSASALGRATMDLGVLAGALSSGGADGRGASGRLMIEGGGGGVGGMRRTGGVGLRDGGGGGGGGVIGRLRGLMRARRERGEARREEKIRAARHGGAGAGEGGVGGASMGGAAWAALMGKIGKGEKGGGDGEKGGLGGGMGGGGGEKGGEARRSGKVTAASSLGSLQSYAQTTVKDSGPLGGCFRNSTSEVAKVKRFSRPGAGGAGEGEDGGASGARGLSGGGRRFGSKVEDLGLDECGGDGVEDEPVFGEEVRRNGKLSERPEAFEYPNFALKEYGAPETWNSDVFVLVHNAVRWEVMDLYTIIGSLQRRWLGLAMRDVYDFAEFWEVFELFVAQTFEVEDQIVFPYLLGQAAASEELGAYYTNAKYSKEKLVGMLYDVGATIEMFNTSDPGEVFPSLYRQLVDFLPSMLEYMEAQDRVLPSVFEGYCHPEDRIMLNRAVANFLIRAAHGRDAIAILTRWIEDTMVLQIWKDENLSARAKNSHAKWIKRLETSHTAIARRFQRRLRAGNPSAHLKTAVGGMPQVPDRADPPAGSGVPDRARFNETQSRRPMPAVSAGY